MNIKILVAFFYFFNALASNFWETILGKNSE